MTVLLFGVDAPCRGRFALPQATFSEGWDEQTDAVDVDQTLDAWDSYASRPGVPRRHRIFATALHAMA